MTEHYLDHLSPIAKSDVEGIIKADVQYGSSWKKRGGVGAFMMLARKWDRIEQAISPNPDNPERSKRFKDVVPYDIFGACQADLRAEGIIDDVRDLRRYLLLVEAHLVATGVKHEAQRDNKPDTGTGFIAGGK